MPSKKKKYNSRFPPARIKKIMQSDEEVGKVAQVVPIIISKALEIFVASLLQSSSDITRSRNARTLTPNHIKQSILSSDQFNFLREIAQTIPDVNPGAEGDETEEGGAIGGQQTSHSLQRKGSENRTTSATSSSGHQLSAAGQTAAVGFRGRGRPRKRLLPESQSSSIRSMTSMTSTEEPEDDEETEEEDEEDEDEEEEPQQSLNSDNNRVNSNQELIISNNNNNNSNSSNNFSVINANYYYSPTQPPHPSPYVSTIQHSMAASSSAAAVSATLKPSAPVIDEDDDYDN